MVIMRNLTKDLNGFNHAFRRTSAGGRVRPIRFNGRTAFFQFTEAISFIIYRPGRLLNEPNPSGAPGKAGACGCGMAMPLGWRGNSGAGVI
jgi:hypothetical protein